MIGLRVCNHNHDSLRGDSSTSCRHLQKCKGFSASSSLKFIGLVYLGDGAFSQLINLDSAVERTRVGCHGVGWQGVTRQQAPACNDEQRRQRAPGRLNRVCSAVTHLVSLLVVKDVNGHAGFQRKISGQLPNLG
jgi:hypothetical protein